jgi:methionine aminopeptidase
MIKLKTKEEIEILIEAGKRLAQIMRESEKFAKPGISSLEVESFFFL